MTISPILDQQNLSEAVQQGLEVSQRIAENLEEIPLQIRNSEVKKALNYQESDGFKFSLHSWVRIQLQDPVIDLDMSSFSEIKARFLSRVAIYRSSKLK